MMLEERLMAAAARLRAYAEARRWESPRDPADTALIEEMAGLAIEAQLALSATRKG